MRVPSWIFCLSLAACAGQPTPKEQADATRRAVPRCEAGDQPSCAAACAQGGPNRICDRACKADDGPSCGALASRLEHEQDADDADSPVRTLGPQDADEITALFERACRLGHGASCVPAGNRIMNGQGRGTRSPAVAVDLLKAGCEKLKEAQSCCAMAQLNAKLAQGQNQNSITDFAEEARRWQKVAERRGATCPLESMGPPTSTKP